MINPGGCSQTNGGGVSHPPEVPIIDCLEGKKNDLALNIIDDKQIFFLSLTPYTMCCNKLIHSHMMKLRS